MGSGTWSPSTYASGASARVTSGTDFGYHSRTRASGIYKSHADLDPKTRNSEGQIIREARDNADHPLSLPIVVGFDATGSMGGIPRQAQKSLGTLFDLLTDKGYATDPQVAITAYGDAWCDRVPLQISQFESDNRIDDNLDNLFLEGGGGGNSGETQTLLWYFLSRHAVTDAWEKRGKKGYIFLIADEVPLKITPEQVDKFVGPDETPDAALLTVDALAEAVKEKWDVYILLVDNMSAKMQNSREVYTNLFGADHIIDIEDMNTVTETIGAAIGFLEGTVTGADKLEADLTASGASKEVALKATQAVTKLRGSKTVAEVNGLDDLL